MTQKEAKILIFDIETAPNEGYTWGKYEQNVIEFTQDWYMLCFAAKWLGEKKVHTAKLNDFNLYKKDKKNDKEVLKKLWDLLDQADVVVAHNGNRFDIKKSNARFVYHGLPPPSFYHSIDTLTVARRYFKFSSNKLDDLCAYFGIGNKLHHEGFGLWKKCMAGERKAWNKMMKYNVQDIQILEKLYLKLRPWITNHPNRALLDGNSRACPNCGEDKLQKKGLRYTRTNVYQRWICTKCGAQCSGRTPEKSEKPMVK